MKRDFNIPKTFFGFLLISFLFWLLINLSKEYEVEVNYKVKYSNLLQDKILQEEPVKEIKLLVKGTGFKLFADKFSGKKIELFADKLIKKSKNNYCILLKNQHKNIQKQLKSGLELKEIKQDTIFLKLGSLETKKVPVISEIDIKYKLGYNIVGNVEVKPDSISISGPELQLQKINNIKLEKLILEDISTNISEKLPIVLPKGVDKIKTSNSFVEVKINVGKFTEKEFEVPVIVKNIRGVKLNIFPRKVKVFFKVQLSDFNKITKDSFDVFCDFNEVKGIEQKYLTLKLEPKSKYIFSYKIVPNKVDFLIHK